MSGQIRLRVCYLAYRSKWFDYLMVSKGEMGSILDGTGWRVKQFIDLQDRRISVLLRKRRRECIV